MNTETVCCVLAAPLEEDEAKKLAAQLKALADPVRLRLVSIVAASESGECCACDLPEALGKSQPTVSHHLSQLVSAGVLAREQRGKWAWFRLTDRLQAIRYALGDGLVGTLPSGDQQSNDPQSNAGPTQASRASCC